MKKILISILGILGIFGFVSAYTNPFYYMYQPPNLNYDFSSVNGYVVGGKYSSAVFVGNDNTTSVGLNISSPFYVFSKVPINFLSDYLVNHGLITLNCSRFNDTANLCQGSWYSITPLDPKFKVNYGDVSYEYTLTENLEIYLNSPVVKSGDVYSYDGYIGINLFYNGTSLFYNKDQLFLYTPSRYSNNIFNPICL